MANARELKERMASIQETRKITNAMYLIASTKLRRAKNDLERTRPYFYALRNEIKRIFRTVRDVESRYFYPPVSPVCEKNNNPPRFVAVFRENFVFLR